LSYTDEVIGAIVRQTLGLAETTPLAIVPIAKGGSKRRFYRVRTGGSDSIIFMHYDRDRRENCYYAAQAGFLRSIGVAVPVLFHHDPDRGFLLMEDLGEEDLWSYREAAWEIRRNYYCRTLALVGKLHAWQGGTAGPPLMEAFGPALYRWEQDYFLQNFVEAVCHLELPPAEAEALKEELAGLAEALGGLPPCLVHRDLQSQNVMLRDGGPVLIDFQGMRFGNPCYDLASLLYDPYVSFTEGEREELFDYYCGLFRLGGAAAAFRMMFRQAAAQRLMQALGAYGFLGLKAQQPEFLAHIPAGIENLITALGVDPQLAHLGNLARRCREVVPLSL